VRSHNQITQRTRVALATFSQGVLPLLFVDVLEHGFGIAARSVRCVLHGGRSGSQASAAAEAAAELVGE
jgi:hypothetical protein